MIIKNNFLISEHTKGIVAIGSIDAVTIEANEKMGFLPSIIFYLKSGVNVCWTYVICEDARQEYDEIEKIIIEEIGAGIDAKGRRY